ncbi:hypothetical protein BV20DRAFT_662166 [Pilatotrama ljubarskyi]|nr:hypothetical protein BV20DRAFT_662166 [Pilatotrama ljubarskyi]
MNIGACMGVASRVARCTCTVGKHVPRWSHISSRPHPVRALSVGSRDLPPHTSVASSAPASSKSTRALPDQQLRTSQPPKEGKSVKELRKPRNEEIKYSVVRLADPKTGALEPPAPLRQILSRIDRKQQFLELVTDKPEPVVRIFDKKLLYDREKAKKLIQANKRPPEEKEVQLTWGVASGDMQFKLRKVLAELEEGNRVNLVIAPKKGQKLPSPAEQEKLIQEVLSFVADVAKERKERTVQKQAVAIFLESIRPKRTVELRWTYSDNDSWEGLRAVESALRSGERVEAIFVLPPPPKKEKNGHVDASAAKAVEPVVVQERVERTLQKLAEVGREWKPRDVRKAIIVAHLEGASPA